MNVDQAAVLYLPTSKRSCSPVGSAQGRENPNHCLLGIWHAGRLPGISVTHTENHWSSVQTMVELVEEVDQRLNPGDVKVPWMLLLDVCPLHVSTAFGTSCVTPIRMCAAAR